MKRLSEYDSSTLTTFEYSKDKAYLF